MSERTAILSNFTIQHGGNATGNPPFSSNGGIWLNNSTPTITNNVITRNMCWDLYANYAGPLIANNEISATQSPQYGCGFGSGAGIYIGGDYSPSPFSSSSVPAIITGNTIENNVLSGLADAGGNGGGGIAVWGGSPLILNNILRNNASPGGSGGAINLQSGDKIAIEQNLIYGNSAGCGGGAIAFNFGGDGPASLLVANNTIANNTGTDGAGYTECISISQIYPFPDAYGGSGPAAVFVNNIIAGSTTDPAVDCAWFDTPSEANQPLFDHNILYNAGGPFFGSYCVDVSAKYGNIAADPQFNDPANNNYHLKSPTSPAIDSGNNSALQIFSDLAGDTLTTDFDGNARVQDATNKGYPVIDMGAYEFAGKTDASTTTVVLTSSAYAGPAASSFVLTANAASPLGTPTGKINFFLDGKDIGTAAIGNGGVATLPNVTIGPGIHSLYASYPGEGSFPPTISVIVIVVIDLYDVNLTLSSSNPTSVVGQPITFTVTASSADPTFIPTPITLSNTTTNTTLATLTPNAAGVATYTTSSLPLGGYFIQAAYAGDPTHDSDSQQIYQQVVTGYASSTALNCQPNSISVGTTTLLTASVTSAGGSSTGSITFTDNGAALSTENLVSGSASLSYTGSSAGTHAILATYNPTGGFAGSSASCSVVVTALPSKSVLAVSPTTANAGSPVTLTANVAPQNPPPGIAMPTGTVTFSNSGTTIGSVNLASGVGALTVSNLPAGSDSLSCQYSGDSIYSASSCGPVAVTIVGNATALTLASSLNPVEAFQPIALTAHLSSSTKSAIPAGSIVFLSNGAPIGTAQIGSGGIAALTINFPVGTDTLTATYAASAEFDAATSNPVTEIVTADATAIALTVSPNPTAQNTAVTLNAQVAPAFGQTLPAGSITFFDGPTSLAIMPVDSNGSATFTSSAFAVGSHTLTAAYSGSPNDLASTSPAQTLVVDLQDFTLAAPPSLTIETGYHARVNLTLASVGSFADTIDLGCSNLPKWATCHFADTPPALAANRTLATSIDLQTDAIYDYKSEIRAPLALRTGIALALLAPLGLLASPRRRRLLRGSTLLLAAVLGASLLALSGCSGLYPPSVAPGTYAITITGQGAATGLAHTATFNLVVTP